MRRLSILLIFTLFTFQSVFSQLSIRPQAGINSTHLSADPDGNRFDSRTGYQFGGDLQIGNKVYFQPGLMFETLQGEFEEIGEIRIHRLRVPVMLGVRFIPLEDERSVNFRLYTGPNVSLVVNKEFENEILVLREDDVKDAVWGWNVGAGIDVAFVFVDVGYSFGLSEVFENADYNARNNLFYANGGLNIRF